MTIRNDLTIDWSSSPRVITVDAPSVEITIQDLYDSLKSIEANSGAMDDEFLIEAAGKENLGGGVSVGLTATLNNALLAFEARLGPTYEQCRVNGGNLVAIDAVGSYFSTPIYPTAFTQVVTTASSSATTTSQAQLEHSTYNDGVTVDTINGLAGTQYPLGTPSNPVNNVNDAVTIANQRGFHHIYFQGDYTFDTGDNVEGLTLQGLNASRTLFTFNAGAETLGCEVWEATVTGNLDGGTILRNCVIQSLNYINGFVYNCMLEAGTLTLGGSSAAHFLNCYSGVPGLSTPIVDCNGLTNDQSTPLAFRNYAGGIQLEDLNGGANVSIDLSSGQVKINLATCTNGTVVVRGNGKVFDTVGNEIQSGTYGNLTVYNEASYGVRPYSVAEAVWSYTGP